MSMPEPGPLLIRPCTLIYLALALLTALTWWVGRAGLGGLGVSVLVLAIALFKAQLIGDWFMGLRNVRGIWRWAIVIWLLLVGGLITLAFVLTYGG